jgi:hypothetical protein
MGNTIGPRYGVLAWPIPTWKVIVSTSHGLWCSCVPGHFDIRNVYGVFLHVLPVGGDMWRIKLKASVALRPPVQTWDFASASVLLNP